MIYFPSKKCSSCCVCSSNGVHETDAQGFLKGKKKKKGFLLQRRHNTGVRWLSMISCSLARGAPAGEGSWQNPQIRRTAFVSASAYCGWSDAA